MLLPNDAKQSLLRQPFFGQSRVGALPLIDPLLVSTLRSRQDSHPPNDGGNAMWEAHAKLLTVRTRTGCFPSACQSTACHPPLKDEKEADTDGYDNQEFLLVRPVAPANDGISVGQRRVRKHSERFLGK